MPNVYDTGDNNQLDSDGVWNYTYDDEGNQTKKTLGPTDVTWIYEYDHRNRLVHAQQWSEDPTLPGTAGRLPFPPGTQWSRLLKWRVP